jgi:predicted GIY-YIG superfamily endonuclease
MHIFVYMLRCSDGSYYVGSTRASLEQRVSQHNTGHFGGYTAKRRPVILVFQQDFQRITDAIAAERQLKGWSRAKKEALIRGDYETIKALADGWGKRAEMRRALRHARSRERAQGEES